MFKKIVIALVLALTLPVLASAQKFGSIDADAVMQAMPETTAAMNQLQEASKKFEEEYKKLNEEIEKKYQEFQALAADTPESIKERRMQEVQELAQKADRFRQTASEDLQRQQQELMAPINQKLIDAIKSVGQEGGFTMVLPAGVAIYQGADVIDVTPLVRTKLGLK